MRYIPLQAHPDFKVRIPLEGYTNYFRFQWRPNQSIWLVDWEIEELNVAVSGFQVVTGLDLYHGRGLYQVGKLVFLDMQGREDPDFDNFGSRFRLIHASREEVADGTWPG